MATYESLQQAIAQECRRREEFAIAANVLPLIKQGEGQTALENPDKPVVADARFEHEAFKVRQLMP